MSFLQSDYEDAEKIGFEEEFAGAVRDCICTHRFRNDNPSQSIEANVLFDADKIDGAGAIGIARTLVYKYIKGSFLNPYNRKQFSSTS